MHLLQPDKIPPQKMEWWSFIIKGATFWLVILADTVEMYFSLR